MNLPRHRLLRGEVAGLPVGSGPEEALAGQIRMLGLPVPRREVVFAKPRRYRADFLWPVEESRPGLIVEVEGGTWVNGRHSRGAGFEADCEKQVLAVLAGYQYLRVTPSQIDSMKAIGWIERALSRAGRKAA